MKIILVFILMLGLHGAFAEQLYPFDSDKQQAQFTHLLKSLRCLVCQNQDLADSNAELAKDLKAQIYDWVRQGRSDQAIMDDLTRHYGDFILFNPPVKAITGLLWAGPLLFLVIGLMMFARSGFQRVEHE